MSVSVWPQALAALLLAAAPGTGDGGPGPRPAWCAGYYASSFDGLSAEAVARDARAESQFTYCVRVTATYECLAYRADGNVQRTLREAVAHGTAFGLRREGGDTLLVSNHHVTEYPAVTTDEKRVAEVPRGCKKVADRIALVESDKDTFAGDDVVLSRVLADEPLDLSVLRAKGQSLHVIPWKLGRSSQLLPRNVVDIRGFPLGAFRATNQGKVVSALDRDGWGEWDHEDFVVDAALSEGNSGSPVLAVRCETGEFELVGVFHADYSRGKSLNVVVHLDALKDTLATLSAPRRGEREAALDEYARRRLAAGLTSVGTLYFPFGQAPAAARLAENGAIAFEVYPREFPVHAWQVFGVDDLPGSGEDFGSPGTVRTGDARGLSAVDFSALGAEQQGVVRAALDGLRRSALLALALRKAERAGKATRETAEQRARAERELKRAAARQRELLGQVLEFARAPGPDTAEAGARPAAAPRRDGGR